MDASSRPETPRPLSDRARDWLFRLYYSHLLSGNSADAILAEVEAVFTMSDEEWEGLHTRSPYIDDPRAGRLTRSVWERISGEVGAALCATVARRRRLEAAIQEASTRWRLDRMPAVDRALLTIGCFEMLERKARPVRRVINRTVELAKRYGEADSKRFVNGILDQIRKDHGIDVAQ